MGRSPRIEYYGAIYHIIQRGNNKAFIFQDDGDKVNLIKILSEVRELFDFHLLGFVIMDNHYHFIIKTHNIPISKVMHRINTRYAKYYNWRHNRSGSPFEGRYKGILVQNQSYLLGLTRYIHNNPVYAGICSSMDEYKWSSDMFYRMNLNNLVDIDVLLDIFSSDRILAMEKYRELMIDFKEEYTELKFQFEDGEIIGTEEFKESINSEKTEEKTISLNNILKSVCPTELDYRLIKEGSRKRYLTKYKYEYISEAMKQGYTIVEISKNTGITTAAIRNILQ